MSSVFFVYIESEEEMDIFELEKPSDLGEMIYIFIGEDDRFILPFKGSEAEMNQMYEKMCDCTEEEESALKLFIIC